MTRAIKARPNNQNIKISLPPMNLELPPQDLTLEMTISDGVQGFKTCPGNGFISNKQLIVIANNGFRYQDIGSGFWISSTRILQMVLDYINKIPVSQTSIRRVKKHRSSPKPPKPLNAYMLFNKSLRNKISTLIPEYQQKEISKLTGALWRASTASTKKSFRYAAERENHLRSYVTKFHHRACPQSPYPKKRDGCFVSTCACPSILPQSRGNITEVLELKWVSNIDPHVFRSLPETYPCNDFTSQSNSCSNLSEDNMNEEDCSSDLLSWLESWDPNQCHDIASDFVDWSSIISDLSIYIGRIQDHYKFQLLRSFITTGNDINHVFKSPSQDSDLWVPSIQPGKNLEEI